MKFRFLKDKHNGKLHIWNRHQLTREEVIEAFEHRKSEYRDESNAWVRTCTAGNGQLMKIIYIKNPGHHFIITAYYI
jgi:hypothetical protein